MEIDLCRVYTSGGNSLAEASCALSQRSGRPPLELTGMYMADKETVNKSEQMKGTVCLNPIHTALCTYARVLGYELFAEGMDDPELRKLAKQVGYAEALPVAEDPGILSPKAFWDELM